MRQVVTQLRVKFFSNLILREITFNYDTNVTFSSCCDVQRNNGNSLWAEGVNVIYILRAQMAGKFKLPSKQLVCVMLVTHFLLHHLISASHFMLRPPHLPSKTVKVEKALNSFSNSAVEKRREVLCLSATFQLLLGEEEAKLFCRLCASEKQCSIQLINLLYTFTESLFVLS